MGQPTHTLTAHVGKPQLWTTGPVFRGDSKLFGPHNHRIYNALKVILMLMVSPFLIEKVNLWHSKIKFFRLAAARFRVVDQWASLPNLAEDFGLWTKYYRSTPSKALFKDAGQTVYSSPFLMKRPRADFIWSKANFFHTKHTSFFFVKGFPLKKKLSTSASKNFFRQHDARLNWALEATLKLGLLPKLTTKVIAKDRMVKYESPVLWM